jgi:hypothetical protein
MPAVGTAGSDDAGQQSSTSTIASPSTDLTYLYDVKPYHPQPAQTFYVDVPQGARLFPSAHPQYTYDPRLHSNGYIQRVPPPTHLGFGSGGGYFNPPVAPSSPNKLSGSSLPPNTRQEPQLHTHQELFPPPIRRIPQVDPSAPLTPSVGVEIINPGWRHICPPGGSVYGHPTVVLHDVHQPTPLVPPQSSAIPITTTKMLKLLPPTSHIARSLENSSDETRGAETSTPVIKAREQSAPMSATPFTLDKYVSASHAAKLTYLGSHIYTAMAQRTTTRHSYLYPSSNPTISTFRLCRQHPTSASATTYALPTRYQDIPTF